MYLKAKVLSSGGKVCMIILTNVKSALAFFLHWLEIGQKLLYFIYFNLFEVPFNDLKQFNVFEKASHDF